MVNSSVAYLIPNQCPEEAITKLRFEASAAIIIQRLTGARSAIETSRNRAKTETSVIFFPGRRPFGELAQS